VTATPTRNWLDSDWQLSIEPCTAEEQNQPAGHLCESTACANVAVVLVRIAVTEDGESWFVCLDCAVANVQHELTDPEAAPNGWSGEPWCRVCGCTEDDCSNCIERTGQPCSWVERRDAGLANLCSACAP
jgi:hypothetical protein